MTDKQHAPFPWKAQPAARRTSKEGMADVRGGEHGEFVVANYVREEDAAVMVAAQKLIETARRAESILNRTLSEEPYIAEELRYELEAAATRLSLALADVDGLPSASPAPTPDDGLPF